MSQQRRTLNFPVSDLRIVTINFLSGLGGQAEPATHIVHKDDVDRFVQACIKLHGDPGINPHNKQTTAPAESIDVSEPRGIGYHWWATPDLMKNEDYEEGAGVIDIKSKTVWKRK